MTPEIDLVFLFLAAFLAGIGWRAGNWYGRILFPVSLGVLAALFQVIKWTITTTMNVLSLAATKPTKKKATETSTTPVQVTKTTNSTEADSTDPA